MTTYFRYADGLLFEAYFEELLTMSLPTGDDVSSAIRDTNDMAFAAYLDRVPAGIRTLGWNMLTSAIATQLQQRDGELDIDYNARRSAGDLGLAVTKAVLFDVDHADGWLRLASDDDPALRGELRVRARTNSELSKQLLETAGVSRFAPILRDDAAVTFHLCTRLPGEAPPALDAAAEWLRDIARRESADKPAELAMADAAATAIQAIGQSGTIELLFKTGWTPASGGVFYGGLQLPEQPDLLESMQRLIMTLHGAPANLAVIVPASGEDDFKLLQITMPQEAVDEIRRESGMTISHIWLAHEYGCLWFSAGVESSREIIRQSVARCRDAGRAVRTPLVSASVDMERWLSWPQDDPAGIAQLPWYLDENAWWFPPSPMTAVEMAMINNASSKPLPIMQRVFDLGGGQQFWLTVETDESGILVKSELGLALANHMLARMIDSQDRMMQEIEARNQEADRAAEEARKAADSATQPEVLPAPAETAPASSP
jgi:hypothetical protein